MEMEKKCYELEYMRQFNSKPFICERTQPLKNETIFTYDIICRYIEKVIDHFKRENVATNVGIAINMPEHSVDACVLLLSILNYNCYIYPFSDVLNSNTLHNIKASRVSYVCIKESLKEDFSTLQWHQLKDLKIVNDTYVILKVNNVNIQRNWSCCYIMTTSGTTDKPKMVFVPYKCLEPNIKSLSSLLEMTSMDRIFIASPATFDPFMVEFFLTLENGCALIITSNVTRFMADHFIDKYSSTMKLQRGATILQITPSLFRLFGQETIRTVLLNEISSLRCVILGGEEFPSPQEFIGWLPKSTTSLEKCSKKIFNIYGITEVSCWCCIYEFKINQHLSNEPVPLGRVLDNYVILQIVNEKGEILPYNDYYGVCFEGELQIGSTQRKCYMANETINNETNEIKFRSTGDLVYCIGQGNIYYKGRLNNTIKRLGKRLCLDALAVKIKNLLHSKHINNTEIVCLWDEDHVKLLFAIRAYRNSKIRRVLNEHLEPYEQPDRVHFFKEIPLTPHGKINRPILMEHIKMLIKEERPKTPIKIYHDFLHNIFGLDKDFQNSFHEDKEDEDYEHDKRKRLKDFQNCNFIQMGGSSYQALSLATEICNYIKEPTDQRLLLQMLLDQNATLKEIHNFLDKVTPLDKVNYAEPTQKAVARFNDKEQDITLELMWHANLFKCVDANPSLYDNRIVAVGSHSHLLVVVDIETGKILCKLKLPDRIECSVVFIDDHLAAVGCYNGYLYIFNHQTGSIQQEINVNGLIKAKPLLNNEDGLLIVASYGELANVVAICLRSLAIKWHLKLGEKGVYASPIQIDKNTSLICALDGTCGWLNNANGNILKMVKFHSSIFSTPVIIQSEYNKENYLVIAEVSGKISICESDTGKVLYNFQAEGNIFSSVAVYRQNNDKLKEKEKHNEENFTLIFGCHDRNVYCLNFQPKQTLKPLTLLSKVSCESPIYATPVIISDASERPLVCVCTTKGIVNLLRLAEPQSKPLYIYDMKAEIFSTPCCLNSKYLFIGCRDNFLRAFQIKQKHA